MRRPQAGEIRAYGYVAMVFSVPPLILFFANVRSRLYYGSPNYSFLLWIAIYLGAVGFGLVRLRKWAAVLLTLGFAGAGFSLTLLSIARTPFPGSLLSIPWGVMLIAPCIVVLPGWRELK
jgi:hypothetical protein